MRADIQHEVSHDAKNSNFYHVFSTYEDGRRQARANRGVCPKYYNSGTIMDNYGISITKHPDTWFIIVYPPDED